MIKQFKNYLKKVSDSFWDFFFKRIDRFPFLKYYPKGRNHIYDILIEEKRNTDFIVFDVGANIGQSALYYNKILKNPKIYSFEPVKSTFRELLSNAKEHHDIVPFQLALGSKEEKVEILLNDQSLNNSLIKEVYSKNGLEKKEIIDVKTADKFFDNLNLNKIDILKIDTEGYDLEVLKGAKSLFEHKKIKYVFCEVGFNDEKDKVNFSDINSFLKPFNFRLCGFYDTYRVGDNFTFILYMNALFKLNE